MDVQCPATIVCLDAGDPVPHEAGGRRVRAYYARGVAAPGHAPGPVRPAPDGSLWRALAELGDQHRGEGVAVFTTAEELTAHDLRGVYLEVDSAGPVRVGRIPVDNPGGGQPSH